MSNDDLLIEILLRLPILSLLLFKYVSKRWLSLIKNLTFTRSKSRYLDPPSGLYLKRHWSTLKYDFIPFDIRVLPNRSPFPICVDENDVAIMHSCNGLFLCIGSSKFYVYNSSLNHIRILPPGYYSDLNPYMGGFKLAFDPTKSPHFKLVYAADIRGGIQIHVNGVFLLIGFLPTLLEIFTMEYIGMMLFTG